MISGCTQLSTPSRVYLDREQVMALSSDLIDGTKRRINSIYNKNKVVGLQALASFALPFEVRNRFKSLQSNNLSVQFFENPSCISSSGNRSDSDSDGVLDFWITKYENCKEVSSSGDSIVYSGVLTQDDKNDSDSISGFLLKKDSFQIKTVINNEPNAYNYDTLMDLTVENSNEKMLAYSENLVSNNSGYNVSFESEIQNNSLSSASASNTSASMSIAGTIQIISQGTFVDLSVGSADLAATTSDTSDLKLNGGELNFFDGKNAIEAEFNNDYSYDLKFNGVTL